MRIGDRAKFKTIGGWYNSGIIRDINEYSCLIEVDEPGYPEKIFVSIPYYTRVLLCEEIIKED